MKKKKIFKVFVLVTMVTILTFSSFILADVGNINRYDSGFDSDFGSDFGSDFSSSGSDYYVGGYSSSGSSGGIDIFLLVVVIVVLVIVFSNVKKTSRNNTSYNTYNIALRNNSRAIGEQIRMEDKYFSEEKFLSWVRDVFIKLQDAWTKRDWHKMRPFESNELFEQHSAQLQQYIDSNKINVVERINIQFAEIAEHKYDGDKELLVVNLQAVMNDYIIDATTKQVIQGDKNKDWVMKYKMTFARKKGVKTQRGTSNKSTTNCPNCGAPTDITSSGQCEYCGSVITTGEHDWVLVNIESLK